MGDRSGPDPTLTRFWIRSPVPRAPLGFGVTASSLAEAFAMIRVLGYHNFLPDRLEDAIVSAQVDLATLDQQHVVPNSGPVNLRGMWYLFVTVGLPDWAEEKLRDDQQERDLTATTTD